MEKENNSQLETHLVDISNLLSFDNFKKQYRLSRTTIYNYVKLGIIKRIEISGSPFVDISTYKPIVYKNSKKQTKTS